MDNQKYQANLERVCAKMATGLVSSLMDVKQKGESEQQLRNFCESHKVDPTPYLDIFNSKVKDMAGNHYQK